MMSAAVATELLAKDPEGPEFGKASPLGLLIVVLLLVATVLLIWSMNRQLRKLPKSFDRSNPGPDQEADEGTDRQVMGQPAVDPSAGRYDDSGDRPPHTRPST